MNKAALLVIDVENDFVHAEGKVPACAQYVIGHEIIKKINYVINCAKRHAILVIFIKLAFTKNYLECSTNSPFFSKLKELSALQIDAWGSDFHEKLHSKKADIMVLKKRISSFYDTSLEAILRANHIDTLLLTGVTTENEILSTARDAHDRDYNVIVIEDACAAKNVRKHRAALDLLEDMSTIITSAEMGVVSTAAQLRSLAK